MRSGWWARAPAALSEILAREVEPALVIGVPVGFVGAAEAKDALRRSGLPSLSNLSEKGGPAVAVAAFEALLRIAQNPQEDIPCLTDTATRTSSGKPCTG